MAWLTRNDSHELKNLAHLIILRDNSITNLRTSRIHN